MEKKLFIAFEEARIPHEYLREEDYYETKSVGRGRSDYWCEHCGEIIPEGESHDTHKFYPEFSTYRTHKKCSDKFIESLRTDEDPEIEY